MIITLLCSLFSTFGHLKDETESIFHDKDKDKREEHHDEHPHKFHFMIPVLIAGVLSFLTVHFIRKEHDKHPHGLRI